MSAGTFQERSRELCKEFGYHRVGGYDPETGTAWACDKNGYMFHIDMKTGWPLYGRRFLAVTKFQEGFACGKRYNGVWEHIDTGGWPAYPHQYRSVGLFFEGRADAIDDRGRFHITNAGVPAYDARYEYVGHFCHGLAQAIDSTGHFHIKRDGTPAYSLRGLRNGPFQDIDGQILAWTEIRKICMGKKRVVRVWVDTEGKIVIDDTEGIIIDQ